MKKNRIVFRCLVLGVFACTMAQGAEPETLGKSRPVHKRVSSAVVIRLSNEKKLLMDGLEAAKKRLSGKSLTKEEKKAFRSVAKRGLILVGLIAATTLGAVKFVAWKKEQEEREKMQKRRREVSGIVTLAALKANYNNVLQKNLLQAVQDGDQEEVQRLLGDGVSPNFADNEGNFPLREALEEGYSVIAELLLQHRADPNIQEPDGSTLLHSYWSPDEMELLLKYGANPNIRTRTGETPLHRTISSETTTFLLKYGADPNAQDDKGDTPLMQPVSNLRLSQVAALLKAGADYSIKNNEGKTALDILDQYPYKDNESYKRARELFRAAIGVRQVLPAMEESTGFSLPPKLREKIGAFALSPPYE